MTKSWWSGEPGEHLLDAALDTDDFSEEPEETEARRLPVTWWAILIAVVVLVAFVGAIGWMIYEAAHHCSNSTQACFKPSD